jgi:hypothetical protein
MYLGDFALGATLDFKFTTRAFATGAPTTLSGTPVVSAYLNNSTTEVTAGITLSVDFDSRTGLNNVRAVMSSGNGYAAGDNVQFVITTGTVGGTSVVGEVVGQASIEARSALRPTTSGRTLDVTATGAAGIDWGNVENPTTAVNLSGTNIDVDQVVASVSGAVGSVTGNVGGSVASVASGGISEASFATTAGSFSPLGVIDQGTAQAATSTTLQLRSAAAFANDEIVGSVIVITGGSAGVGQSRVITDYVSSTDTATVDAWTTTPTGTITYKIFAAPPADSTAAAIKAVTDKLDGMLELDGGSAGLYQFTPTALAEGGGSPAAVWNYDISGIVTAGTAGDTLNSAGSAGDPWGTLLPGAYGAGTAGKIIGDNINATISSRASQTSVDTVDTVVDAIKVKTDFLPSATAGAAGGVFIAGSNAATTVNFTGSLSGSVGSVTGAVGSVTGAVGSVTGNVGGNVAGSVASVTGAVGSVTGNVGGNVVGSVASVVGAVGSVTGLTASDVAAIKAKTDSLTFTTAGMVDSAVKRVGSTTLTLAGTGGQGYGG